MIFKTICPHLLVKFLLGPKIRGRTKRQIRISGIPGLCVARAACDRCRNCCHMRVSLLQMEEKGTSQNPGLAIVRTRGKLAWVGPSASRREFSIVNLVIKFWRKRKIKGRGSHRVCFVVNRGNLMMVCNLDQLDVSLIRLNSNSIECSTQKMPSSKGARRESYLIHLRSTRVGWFDWITRQSGWILYSHSVPVRNIWLHHN